MDQEQDGEDKNEHQLDAMVLVVWTESRTEEMMNNKMQKPKNVEEDDNSKSATHVPLLRRDSHFQLW